MEPNNDNDCPICYGPLGDVESACPNAHKVCGMCLPHIRRANNTCPMCRAVLLPPAPDEVLLAPPPMVWLANINHELADIEARHGGMALAPDAVGRVAAGGDRELWADARRWFLYKREHGDIPAGAVFGGVHIRNCGHRGCGRRGGVDGVRFMKGPNGKRRYRCEEHEHV